MIQPDHPGNELLAKLIDDELSSAQGVEVESHLARCEECAEKVRRLRFLSMDIENLLRAIPVDQKSLDPQVLAGELEQRKRIGSGDRARTKVFRHLRWGMAIAAALALAVLFVPQSRQVAEPSRALPAKSPVNEAFEVDGETFIALPFSNLDVPMNAPHIVQMQMPLSSLADAGVVFTPVSNEGSPSDRSILADVLLGIDGQPLGVHVLGLE